MKWGVSGQSHALDALLPGAGGCRGHKAGLDVLMKRILAPARNQNLITHSVASYFAL